MDAPAYLLGHRAHDAEGLLERWEALAVRVGWQRRVLAKVESFEIVAFRSDDRPRLYLSAGVHGDEPAGAWGLLEWAESHWERLARVPLAVVPCFSPWGLTENRRLTAWGEDLNRLFHRRNHPLVGAWQDWLEDWCFDLSICLHEDYDARGIYIYELAEPGFRAGAGCLERCESIIPREPGPEIEGRPVENGLIALEGDPVDLLETMAQALPEALYLRQHHTRLALTFETPSEYSFFDRVQCQRCFLDAAMDELGRLGIDFAENFCGT